MIHDGQPVTELLHLGHVVAGQQDRAAGHGAFPVDHQLAHGTGGRDVQAQGRLIEEEDPRIVQQAARQVQLLTLTGGERGYLLLALLLEAHEIDQLVHAAPALTNADAVELTEHPELLAHQQQAVPRLFAARDDVHDPADLGGLSSDVEAEDAGRAGRGQEQRGEDLDECRLAGTVGPEQAEQLGRLDLEVDAVEGHDRLRLGLVDAPHGARVDGQLRDRARGRVRRCVRG